MWIEVLQSKIHTVQLTASNLHYMGSIGVDEALLAAARISVHQKVQVVNLNNGERLDTYIIARPAKSGIIELNGAAARKALVGDTLLIIAYAMIDSQEVAQHQPTVIFPNKHNQLS